jgi:hypothetical protein
MPTIQFNFGYFIELGALPFPVLLARLFLDGGWIIILIVFIQGCWLLWVQSRQAKYGATIQNVILAVDIPKLNEQTPLAVEQIFSHLSGAYSGLDKYEKYWLGKFNPTFSFELVSIEGYVQYVVHCPKKYRDLVESSIYAQYPDAEITEIQDYTDKVPKVFPHPEWDAFGTEFALKKPSAYPIRTYPLFEHRTAEVMTFKDPISSVLEVMSNLKRGEQLWIQVLLVPTDDSWQKKSDELADKMLGKKKPVKKSMGEEILEAPLWIVKETATQLANFGSGEGEVKKSADQPKMLALSPGERGVLEAIQMKASKIGFLAKIRVVYVGRRDVFSKGRYTSLKGAFNQFSSTNMNAFKGYGPVTPKGDYFWQKWTENEKKTAVVRNYRNRSGKGAPHFILNTEELATIYHFPMSTVKAPLVKKTESKRAEPPPSLPTEDRFPRTQLPGLKPTAGDKDGDGLPDNLPFA